MQTRHRTRRKLVTGAPVAADLLAWELCWSVDNKLWIGTGNDGTGNATGVKQLTGVGASIAIADVTGLTVALAAKLDDSQASAFGLSLLNDASASAARTTLGLHAVAASGAYSDLSGTPDLSALNDVAVYANLSDFPGTGNSDFVYIANDTGYMYRWNGSSYTQITDQTAIWGQIGGTLSAQTDLQVALNARPETTDSPTWSGNHSWISGSSEVYIVPSINALDPESNNGGAMYFGVGVGSATQPTAAIEASWGGSVQPQMHIGVIAGGKRTFASLYYSDTSGTGFQLHYGATRICQAYSGGWTMDVPLVAPTVTTGSIALPGTTSQYVRGDGSLATLAITWDNVTGKPSFAAVATSGAYSSLSGLPSIPNSPSDVGAASPPTTCTAATSNSNGATHTHNVTGFLATTGGTLTGTLTGTTIQASTIREASDRRLKDHIKLIENGRAIVSQLRAVRFTRKDTGATEIGLIAQEVQDVLPQVVREDEDGTLAVAYQRIVAPLIAAVQEQDAMIADLHRRLSRLEPH